MNRRVLQRTVASCFLVLLMIPSVLHAFDGQRKGFILGGGAGFGATSIKFEAFKSFLYQEDFFGSSDRTSHGSFNTDIKIGYAFNEQIQLYWSERTCWFTIEYRYSGSVTAINDLGGPGMSYYFSTMSPSWYVFGSLGFATFDLPFEDYFDAWAGVGASLGGGYEFSRHWSVDVAFIFTRPQYNYNYYGVTFKAPTHTIRIAINGLAY